MTTPSIPGIDPLAVADAIQRRTLLGPATSDHAADAALAHIAAHHECACDREHADEWVEVDVDGWHDLPVGARLRLEWKRGASDGSRYFVHRDDLPDPDPRTLLARELGPAKADTFFGLLDEHGWTVTRKDEREAGESDADA